MYHPGKDPNFCVSVALGASLSLPVRSDCMSRTSERKTLVLVALQGWVYNERVV